MRLLQNGQWDLKYLIYPENRAIKIIDSDNAVHAIQLKDEVLDAILLLQYYCRTIPKTPNTPNLFYSTVQWVKGTPLTKDIFALTKGLWF